MSHDPTTPEGDQPDPVPPAAPPTEPVAPGMVPPPPPSPPVAPPPPPPETQVIGPPPPRRGAGRERAVRGELRRSASGRLRRSASGRVRLGCCIRPARCVRPAARDGCLRQVLHRHVALRRCSWASSASTASTSARSAPGCSSSSRSAGAGSGCSSTSSWCWPVPRRTRSAGRSRGTTSTRRPPGSSRAWSSCSPRSSGRSNGPDAADNLVDDVADAPTAEAPEAVETEDAADAPAAEADEPAEPEATVQSWADETFGTFTPGTQTGTGDNLVALPAGATAGIVTATHDGAANFAISVLDAENGSTGELLVNTIGPYTGTTCSVEG